MKFLFFLLFFVYVWSFKVTFCPINPILVLFIPGVFLLIEKAKAVYFKIFVLLLIPVFYSIWIGCFFETYQFGIAYMIMGEICRFIGAFTLVELVSRYSKLTGDDLIFLICKYYIFAIMFQVCLSVYLEFFNNELLMRINGDFVYYPDEVVKYKVLNHNRFKVLGATNFTTAALLVYSAALLYLHFMNNGIWKTNLKNILCVIFLIITSCFLGRSVLVTYTIALPFFIKRLNLRLLTFLVFILVPCMFYIMSCLPEHVLRYAFEPIYNFVEDGVVRTDSTDDLLVMWGAEVDSWVSWLLGEGFWIDSNGSYYKNTDAGYLRSIFYWGIPGTIVCFIAFLISLTMMIKTSPCYMRSLLFLFVLVWLVYNIKVFCLPFGMFGGLFALIFISCNNHSYNSNCLIKN